MPDLQKPVVLEGFNHPRLQVITDKDELHMWLSNHDYKNANLVLMSSGNYDGLDVNAFAKKITV